MKKKIIIYTVLTFGVLFLASAVLIFRPVPIVSESKAIVEKGIVTDIYGTKGNDIIFRLKDNPRRFYINRGLENGLELEHLKSRLTGHLITVKYPKYWTPLDWNNSIKHISKLEFNGETLFNELKQ